MKAVLAVLMPLMLSFNALLPAQAAFAQDASVVRPNIPAQAKKLVVDADNGALSVKGKPLQLAASIQIRDAQNRLKLSQSLNGRYNAAVLFDANGAASRIWLLGQ